MSIESKNSINNIKNYIANLWAKNISNTPSSYHAINFLETKKTKRVPIAALRILELQSHLLDSLKSLLASTQKTVSNIEPPALSLKKNRSPSLEIPFHFSKILTNDAWGFGMFWTHIQCVCQTPQSLYEEIAKKRTKIAETRAQFVPILSPISELRELLTLANLTLNPIGISGSYILYGKEQVARFIIKPFDEDIGAINNPKGFASPFLESPLLEGMPLYLSCFREAAAYQVAEILRIASIVPRTLLAIVQSDQFFDLSEQVSPREMQNFFEQVGYHVNKEKLCSVQDFVLESKSLFEALQEFQTAGLLDEEIEALIDQKDFEEANLFLWITGDSDGHANNFLVFPKRIDEIGNQILGIKKIDNGFAFPSINAKLYNYLSHLPNAKHPLSSSLRAKILQINSDIFSDVLKRNELESARCALQKRIETLKEIVKKNPSWSIQTIHNKLCELL